jgi:hypothetical protein
MASSHRLTSYALLGAAVVLCASAMSPAGAEDYDGTYIGFIRCDAIPGQTLARLQTDFTLKVAAGPDIRIT